MDIQLRGINGYEVTKQIKTIRSELPFIAQTAFALADEKEACFESGCDGFIAKPIQSNMLLPLLYKVLYSSYTKPE